MLVISRRDRKRDGDSDAAFFDQFLTEEYGTNVMELSEKGETILLAKGRLSWWENDKRK